MRQRERWGGGDMVGEEERVKGVAIMGIWSEGGVIIRVTAENKDRKKTCAGQREPTPTTSFRYVRV